MSPILSKRSICGEGSLLSAGAGSAKTSFCTSTFAGPVYTCSVVSHSILILVKRNGFPSKIPEPSALTSKASYARMLPSDKRASSRGLSATVSPNISMRISTMAGQVARLEDIAVSISAVVSSRTEDPSGNVLQSKICLGVVVSSAPKRRLHISILPLCRPNAAKHVAPECTFPSHLFRSSYSAHVTTGSPSRFINNVSTASRYPDGVK
mmetsp:Transcript_4024/g.25279  ORF Transcript_4024/g.25279 Transcript_4024/m.25279 type:complete len:209 (-) Transcript_4024:2679-3305(-)